MSTGTMAPHTVAVSTDMQTIPGAHTVVAVVIEWRGKIALFKRSRHVDHDGGLWRCVSGYVESGASPEQQALAELLKEAGLLASNLLDLRRAATLVINDDEGAPWLIHPFTAVSSQRRLQLDREQDSYRWTAPNKVKRFSNRVPWLDRVLHATGSLTEPVS